MDAQGLLANEAGLEEYLTGLPASRSVFSGRGPQPKGYLSWVPSYTLLPPLRFPLKWPWLA